MLAGFALKAPDVGAVVPVCPVLAETAGQPCQCARLCPDQETCNVMSTLRRSGGGYALDRRFAVDFGATRDIEVTQRLEEPGSTSLC